MWLDKFEKKISHKHRICGVCFVHYKCYRICTNGRILFDEPSFLAGTRKHTRTLQNGVGVPDADWRQLTASPAQQLGNVCCNIGQNDPDRVSPLVLNWSTGSLKYHVHVAPTESYSIAHILLSRYYDNY